MVKNQNQNLIFQYLKIFFKLICVDIDIFENRAPGFRRQPITYDYHNLRVAATQGKNRFIMHKNDLNFIYFYTFFYVTVSQSKPNRSEVRVPTSVWSGYGFSHSSPSAILKGQHVNKFFIFTVLMT